jgi:hypothetical protein
MTEGRRTLHALNAPQPVRVAVGGDGLPAAVGGREVEAVRVEWRVEEGWWTDVPIRRRYLELVLAGGRIAMVFEDRRRPGRWYVQQAGG